MLTPPLLRPLTPTQTHVSALGLTICYVGGIYLSNFLFKTAATSKVTTKHATPQRNDPDVIARRIGAVTLATIAGLAAVEKLVERVFGIQELPGYALKTTAVYLGLPIITPAIHSTTSTTSANLTASLGPYLLTPLLFLGPLYCLYLDRELPWQAYGSGWSLFDWTKSFGPYGDGKNGLGIRRGEEEQERVRVEGLRKGRLMALRDYVVGPISEELVFRSCIIAIYKLGNSGWKTLVFGTPLWFGVAHAHHAYGRWRQNGSTGKAAVGAIAVASFQLTYTTLFGWYAAWLFVKTGSVIPSIAAHIFANSMGLPAPQSTLRAFPEKRTSIWLTYLLGVVGFTLGVRYVQDLAF